jgi:hypothetical protein
MKLGPEKNEPMKYFTLLTTTINNFSKKYEVTISSK